MVTELKLFESTNTKEKLISAHFSRSVMFQ
jgi:hypothetical protein